MMEKSVYSLVLSDGVVAAVDRLAYENGTSRSNLINQILADYVSYITPEKRVAEIFDRMQQLLEDSSPFQLLAQPSDSMMSLRSALRYKYNPTVRYSVELTGGDGGRTGILKVSLRSQNAGLIAWLEQFFRLWSKLETVYVGERERQIQPGRFTRVLRLPAGAAHGTQGEEIMAYIRGMDGAMKAYFACLDDPERAVRQTEQRYRKDMSGTVAAL